jgi:alpha-tubulin suppressor-like RCC1 family protein
MKGLFPALLLAAACGSGLVDHVGAQRLPDTNGQCAAPRRNCDGVCMPDDVNNCGACGRTCPAVARASSSCVAGECQFTCNPGFLDCAHGCCEATSLAAGGDTSCAVVAGGAVRCWGSNDSGQLGTSPSGALWSAAPVAVPGLGVATSVAVGEHHACAILAGSGGVACWGANGSGQVGSAAAQPAILPGISGVQALALGGRHSCARTASSVVCWGANDSGQLGDGTWSPHGPDGPAVALPYGRVATSIAAGSAFSCAVASGALYCWGSNSARQLGGDGYSASFDPREVREVSSAQLVGAGASHACGIGSGFWCWGANSFGQVGNGKEDEPRSSVDGVDLDAPSLVAGGLSHTCALSNGALYCWGSNWSGQLGLGVPTVPQTEPVAVPGLTVVQRLALGATHSCAQRADGAVLCWGNNGSGQVGAPVGGTFLSPRPID